MSQILDPSAELMQAMQTMLIQLYTGQGIAEGLVETMKRQQEASLKPGAATQGQEAMPPETNAITQLQMEFAAKHAQLWQAMLQYKPEQPMPVVADAASNDRRFSDPAWAESPIYDYYRQSYLINAEFLRKVAEVFPVVDEAARERLCFVTGQYIDAMAPSNFAVTNPEFIKTAIETQGQSITAGIRNMLADMEKGSVSMTDETAFEIGRDLATTPGAVVFQNELIQLIQYSPLTDKVAERPLVIVPPCINKYYILDLQRDNSLVRYAVEQGNTVFLISWRNPTAKVGCDWVWDHYLEEGILKAFKIAREICGVDQVNALGFCIGGTLVSSAIAVAKGRGEDPVASLTLLTTLLDFTDPGQLGYFIDPASIAIREAKIGKRGLLTGQELSSVFSSLRPNDLIWQYVVGNYLKGRTPPAFDMLFWNADSTSMPGPFAVFYLRKLYLENLLRIPGKLQLCGVKVDLRRINMPTFLFASREDHIVPWKGAYLSRGLLGGKTTFVKGASGHISGVVNGPIKNKRSYWTSDSTSPDPEEWMAASTEHKGSWWPCWAKWLADFGGKQCAARRRLGNKTYKQIEPAPGSYVKEKCE